MSVRRARVATFSVVALAAVTSADTCQTGPSSGEPGAPQVEFTLLGALEAGEDSALRIDSVSSGEVVLAGALSTPTPCYTISAGLSPSESALTVSLVATAQPVICVQVLATFRYRARIYGLKAGRYTVEVVATYPGTGWPPREERVQVDIP